MVNWTIRNKLKWNFNQNTKLFIHENASEGIVCKMASILSRRIWVYTWWPEQNGCHLIDNNFKCISRNENCIWFKFLWQQTGSKPIPELMLTKISTICQYGITRPQWGIISSKCFDIISLLCSVFISVGAHYWYIRDFCHHWFKVLAWCLFGTKPLCTQMLILLVVELLGQIAVRFKLKYGKFNHKNT